MSTLSTFIAELIFPRFCIGCGYVGTYICLNCAKKLAYNPKDTCLYCKKASPYGLTHAACIRPRGVEGFMTVLYYNDFLKKIIKSIKYRLAREVAGEFFLCLNASSWSKLAAFSKLAKELVIVPIPLHPSRLKKRGFNQAALMVDFICELLPSPKLETLVRRTNTPAQASFKKKLDRHRNMQSAFEIVEKNSVAGKTILLVDDVVTSGATVKDAAHALKKAGAAKVYVFALAKG